MKTTPVKIIRAGREAEHDWLAAHGFDGLYTPEDACGCFNDDLYPCGERGTRMFCVPGKATGDGIGPYCERDNRRGRSARAR